MFCCTDRERHTNNNKNYYRQCLLPTTLMAQIEYLVLCMFTCSDSNLQQLACIFGILVDLTLSMLGFKIQSHRIQKVKVEK